MKWHHRLVRFYTWHELPGWGKVYERFVGGWQRDGEWMGEPPRLVQGKLHGYQMELDLSRWSQRATFFLGRFYDLELQLLLRAAIRPGDRFVDIGANVGMVSLLASRLVGESGVVDAFEPNPACVAAIRGAIARNAISNIRLHPVGVAEAESVLPLTIPTRNTGEATLTPAADEFGGQVEIVEVPVKVGDEVLSQDASPPVFIKIDVEGFEARVLAGLRETLSRHRPLVAAEVVADFLRRDGRAPADLFKVMEEFSYTPYNYTTVRQGPFRRRLSLTPAAPDHHENNVLWVPRSGPLADRIGLFLR